jgi:hypothetical protein
MINSGTFSRKLSHPLPVVGLYDCHLNLFQQPRDLAVRGPLSNSGFRLLAWIWPCMYAWRVRVVQLGVSQYSSPGNLWGLNCSVVNQLYGFIISSRGHKAMHSSKAAVGSGRPFLFTEYH